MFFLPPLLLLIHLVLVGIAASSLALQERQATEQIMWTLFMLFVPFVGVAFYVLVGRNRIGLRRVRRRSDYHAVEAFGIDEQDGLGEDQLAASIGDIPAQTFRAIAQVSGLPTVGGNHLRLVTTASRFYDELAEAFDSAEERIWLSFFVWRFDDAGSRLADGLRAAARRGVDVRLLIDEIGSKGIDDEALQDLREAGVRFSWATTINPRRNRWFINLRNHRKIVVIDHECAYTGGMNVGCEYRDGFKGAPWHDCQVVLRGPAIEHLAAVFASDWHFATEERLHASARPTAAEDGVPVQVLASGPEDEPSAAARSLQGLIAGAQRRILMTTPFFFPDGALLSALELAALRGVAVTILVSSSSDIGPIALRLSRVDYLRLLKVGVRIIEYDGGIHHSKLAIFDDRISVIGSINLDVRSLHLNYEIALVVIDQQMNRAIEDLLNERLSQESLVIDEDFMQRRKLRVRLTEGYLRMLKPLM